MYTAHYELTAKPFSIVPNPQFLFLSKNHANALTYLEYGLSERTGFILLTGEIGAGKTTLVRHMINEIGPAVETAVIFNTNFSSDQLFRQILSEFDVDCEATEKEGLLAQLYQFLIDRYAQGRHVLLIIDEAQNLGNETLEDVRMLSNLQTDDQILLQIMLVGQPELRSRLRSPEFHQLAQRIAVNYHIRPLDREQTYNYIQHRLEKAGGRADLFSQAAMDLVFKHSGGIPRTINLLCDTALVYGFADQLAQIDAPVVEKVLEDDICMAVSEDKSSGKAFKRVLSKAETGPGIMERIHYLEASFRELRQQHEELLRAVHNDLQVQYRQLLLTERQRYDRLLEKYTGLLAARPLPDVPDGYAEDAADGDGAPLRAASKRKFSHLMDMIDAREAGIKED